MRTVVTNHEAGGKIARRETFRNGTGSFSGDVIESTWQATRYLGYLPKGFHESLAQADYVVYSYSTPIGWHVPEEGWHVPEVTYSATTSTRHQAPLRSVVWGALAVRPSWETIAAASEDGKGSPTAALILRNIRAGYTVSTARRPRRIVETVLATGEAVISWDNGERVLAPAPKAA